MARGADGTDAVAPPHVPPYLFGERGPLWRGELIGAIVGLQPEHTARHLVAGAAEGVTHALAEVDAILCGLVGPATPPTSAVG